MCGCANFDGDNEFDSFTSNRPKELVLNPNNLDPDGFNNFVDKPHSFNLDDDGYDNFTSNRPKELVLNPNNLDPDGFNNFGGKGKARRQARRDARKANKMLKDTNAPTDTTGTGTGDTGTGSDDPTKNSYGSQSWFANNWIWVVLGVAVVGGGYYFIKKRK